MAVGFWSDAASDNVVAVNLGADTALAAIPRGVYVGGTGSVKVDLPKAGTGIIFAGVPAGTLLPIAPTKVYSTVNGTTATAILLLY